MDRLDIDQISIRSFYGVPQAGLTAEFGSGLTVVVGPNGQGKTTLARALHGALWPETVRPWRPSYDARFTVGPEAWAVSVEAGEARYARDGVAADRLALPDASYRSRYFLSLGDLVVDDGQDFADAVRRDASGGVDLATARSALGYRSAPPRALDSARRAQDAAAEVRRRRSAQAALRSEAEALPALVARGEAAAEAAGTATLLDLLERRAEAHARALEATRHADAFPAPMENVARDTKARYDVLAEAQRHADATLTAARRDAAEHAQALLGHPWATSDAPSPAELSARVRALDEAARAVADAVKAEAAAAANAAHVAEAIRATGASEGLTVGAGALARVAALATEAGAARAASAEMAARSQVLRAHHNRIQPHDPEALGRGIEALRTWLAYTTETAPAAPALTPGPVWITAGVLAVAAIAAGILGNPWALALLAGVAALAVVAVVLARVPAAHESPAGRAREAYGLLRLDAPEEWTAAHVETRLQALERSAASQDARRLWRERIDEVDRSLDELKDAVRAVEAHEAALSQELGLRVPRGAESLLVLAHQVVAWHAADAARAAAAGERAHAETVRDAALAAVRTLLSGVPIAPPEDAAEAAAAVTTVAGGVAARDGLRRASAVTNAEVDAAAAAHAAAAQSLAAILAPLGLDAPDGPAVARLCDAFEAYHEARTAAAQAAALADEADRAARAHPAFDRGFLALAPAEIALRGDEARLVAAGRDAHLDAAARLRERVDQARAEPVLATAATRYAEALDALETDYDAAADALVGDALAGFVEDDTRDQHLPRVFQRARAHLAEITADRYRLDFDAATGAFRAFDTSTERSLALDALSSGTRLQLLLAVRLAFAEVQEVGFRLPVLIDEALATSDGERASAVIEAVLGVCRGTNAASGERAGRQVVVFTSQADEAARWVRHAELLPDLDCRVVSLPGGATAPADLAAAPAERTTRTVPEPAGHTAESYARATNTAPWTARDPLAALPVALLLAPEAAHACLRAGFDTWGPLRAALRRGAAGSGTGSVPLSEPETRRLLARVAAVDAWQQAWLVGRGRPVDRDVLAASRLVPPAALPEIAALAEAHDGDARALVDALRAAPPAGLRRARIDELDAYLVAQGFVAQGAPLHDADLRAAVAAATAPDALDDALATLARIRTHAEALAAEFAGDGHAAPAGLA